MPSRAPPIAPTVHQLDENAREPPPDPRSELRRELDRWSLCKRFVHQFALMAKPKPREKKRKTGHRGDSGGWTSRLWRPTPITPPKLGLAAVKHAQQSARRSAQQEKAFAALAAVQTTAARSHLAHGLVVFRTIQKHEGKRAAFLQSFIRKKPTAPPPRAPPSGAIRDPPKFQP